MNELMKRARRNELAGKEVFEIQPIILGGDPTDPSNKTVLTRQQHIQAVTYWNREIRRLRQQHGKEYLLMQTNHHRFRDQLYDLND